MKPSLPLLLPALLLALLPRPAFALNTCTDAEGRTSYQQLPCTTLDPNTANRPPAASQLSARLVSLAQARFRAALSQRDVVMAQQHLARDFSASFTQGSQVLRFDRAGFVRHLYEELNALRVNEQQAVCGLPEAEGDGYRMQCRVTHRREAMNLNETWQADELMHFVLEGEWVRLQRWEQVRQAAGRP